MITWSQVLQPPQSRPPCALSLPQTFQINRHQVSLIHPNSALALSAGVISTAATSFLDDLGRFNRERNCTLLDVLI
ncbi:hypothetical protein D3C87_1971640 [compost metagenome]